MAASSSTLADSNNNQWYEVFLNLRGVEVKKSLARSLYLRLHQKGLRTFLDQDELQPGYNFPSQIKDVIRTASAHVAIFSPRYAESYWCLHELVLMLESKTPIIPVFYRVTPAEVRRTQVNLGNYSQALQNVANKTTPEGKSRYDSDTIEKWRNALSQVSYNSGFELEVYNGEELELELLDKVVECLSKMLEKSDLHVADYATGLDYKLKDFEDKVLLQQQQSGKPQILGIVGKKTLAKEFFNRKKSDYLKSCFLFEVKENASSLKSLQSQLFKNLTGLDKQVNSIDEGKAMLIKPLKSFNASRDKGVLRSARVEKSSIYMLTGLNTEHSRELFCSHAFNKANPLQGSEYLIDKFLESCSGLPLSLKVLGAYLYGKEISEWADELGSLPSEVKKKLKISYDALDKEEQHMFLDIACFLREQNRDTAISIWNGSGWKGRRGFQNLQDRCLVEVDSWNVIHLHEHLRNLGRDVAEKLSPFRLWRWTQSVIDDLLQQSFNGEVLTAVQGGLKMLHSEYNKYSDYVLDRIGMMTLQILDTEADVLEGEQYPACCRVFKTLSAGCPSMMPRSMTIMPPPSTSVLSADDRPPA